MQSACQFDLNIWSIYDFWHSLYAYGDWCLSTADFYFLNEYKAKLHLLSAWGKATGKKVPKESSWLHIELGTSLITSKLKQLIIKRDSGISDFLIKSKCYTSSRAKYKYQIYICFRSVKEWRALSWEALSVLHEHAEWDSIPRSPMDLFWRRSVWLARQKKLMRTFRHLNNCWILKLFQNMMLSFNKSKQKINTCFPKRKLVLLLSNDPKCVRI